ncbi:hypothetical protein A3F03_03845 [Candidatus Roizmanbacteria bacterium RIFCSPHIGHO2_12_FULL_41_11]|uniref:Uncharacterized protein n=2 Tax=Candidatus Roizmaniibacteriota TaxID=1752723 RepID=A0A1F7I5L3_9BACT|nr:MAG: hypothetical protein A3F03_03845 [Candidatus Roizmanbacteria bacterium RIFCSPHIGHO2_12_FULL_41_11]
MYMLVEAGRISPEPNTLTKPKLRLMLAIDDIKNTAAQIAETEQRLGRAPLRLVALASVLLTSCAVARPTEVNASTPTPPAPTPTTRPVTDYFPGYPGSPLSTERYGYTVTPTQSRSTTPQPEKTPTPAQLAQADRTPPLPKFTATRQPTATNTLTPKPTETPTPTPTEISIGDPLVTTKDELDLATQLYGGARGGEGVERYIIAPAVTKLFDHNNRRAAAPKQLLDFFQILANIQAARAQQIAQGKIPVNGVVVGNSLLGTSGIINNITGKELNIRTQPVNGNVLKALPNGTELTILSREAKSLREENSPWIFVLATEETVDQATGTKTLTQTPGWVHAGYVDGINQRRLNYQHVPVFEPGALDADLSKALRGEDFPTPTPTATATAKPATPPAVRTATPKAPQIQPTATRQPTVTRAPTQQPTAEQVKSSEVPVVKRRLVEKIRVPGQPDELRDAPFGIIQVPPETRVGSPFDQYELSGIAGGIIKIDNFSFLQMSVPQKDGSWVNVNVFLSFSGSKIAVTQAKKDENGYFIPVGDARTGGSAFAPELVFSIIKPGDQLIALINVIDDDALEAYEMELLIKEDDAERRKKIIERVAIIKPLLPETREVVQALMTGKSFQDGRKISSAAQVIMPNEPEKLLVLP